MMDVFLSFVYKDFFAKKYWLCMKMARLYWAALRQGRFEGGYNP